MTASNWFFLYLLAVIAIGCIHHPLLLGGGLLLALLLSGMMRWRLLLRTLRAVLLFNLTVSVSYFLLRQSDMSLWGYLVMMNLRVMLLVYLGYWLVARINLIQACASWPTLGFIVTLAMGQIQVFNRIIRDFQLAFISRQIVRPRLVDRRREAVAQTLYLLDKSVAMATESSMAMRSRGCFNDHAGTDKKQMMFSPESVPND
ncbi:ABC transporter permease [Ampullimonas aquatilis]|uniref:ABC transporter permease n=1 Tax=Ampullimonas aquatilis TaxID=1341549 RepID=UPI003C72E7A5